MDQPGGRAYQKRIPFENGEFVFDMGPTVLTVPHFIEELFSLDKSQNQFEIPDYPNEITNENTKKYLEIVPILPFYRIYFEDKTYFDYDGDYEHTKKQILELTGSEEEVRGYEKFHSDSKKVFEKGFLELGYAHFENPFDLIKILPDLLQLDVIRNLFSYARKYFNHPKTQFIFSFETLLIGGNPLTIPALYVMIHFVEKTWGIHYATGGTGNLVRAFEKKFTELGGKIEYQAEVEEILLENKDIVLTTDEAISEIEKLEEGLL
jgi:phytoene desaturase